MNPLALLLPLILGGGGRREVRRLIRGLEELIIANPPPGSVPTTDLQNLLARELFPDHEGGRDLSALLLVFALQSAQQQSTAAPPSTGTTTPATTTTGVDPNFLIALVLLLQNQNYGW
jgi:hypothetical protein